MATITKVVQLNFIEPDFFLTLKCGKSGILIRRAFLPSIDKNRLIFREIYQIVLDSVSKRAYFKNQS